MNKTSALRHLPVMISLSLITLVVYALVIQPGAGSQARDTREFKAEILSELAAFETRLSQRMQNADLHQQSYPRNHPDAVDSSQLAVLQQQIEQIMQQQELYQRKLDSIEQRLLNGMNQVALHDSDKRTPELLNVVTDKYENAVENSTRAADNAKHNAPLSDEVVQRRIDRQIAVYEDVLYQEPADPVWSGTIEQKVVRLINKTEQLRGVHLQASTCSTSLCKLDVYVEEGENVEEKVQVLMVSRPWPGESFVTFEFDGHGQIFFAREGTELP